MKSFLVLLFLVAAWGCGQPQTVAVGPEQAASAEVAAAPAGGAGGPVPVAEPAANGDAGPAEAAPSAAPTPVDLLRAVATDLAVSSAYRDKLAQAVSLVDGDPETAWNSRTGELVGAWIEARLPPEATVSSIALTAGFTKVSDEADLFTGNHRVAKVRVLRDGEELGSFPLDVESRELQSLPVQGPGGVYRLEVAEVVAGTKARWREVCVSELRILGSAPTVEEGSRLPRFGLGALPEPGSAPGSADRAQVGTKLKTLTLWFLDEWGSLLREEGSRRTACGYDDDDFAATPDLRLRRRQVFEKVAELVSLVDGVRGDRLRLAAIKRFGPDATSIRILQDGDQDLLAAGFDAVVDWLGEGEARCLWSRADTRLRIDRLEDEVRVVNHICEHISMDYDEEHPAPPELLRECRSAERLLPRVEQLKYLWQSNPRLAAAGLSELTLSEAFSDPVRVEHSALKARVAVTRASCGWEGKAP